MMYVVAAGASYTWWYVVADGASCTWRLLELSFAWWLTEYHVRGGCQSIIYMVDARASCTWWLLECHVRGGC